MARKTLQQKKDAIKPWRARFGGRCERCDTSIKKGSLVCRDPLNANFVIHYQCHPDWLPSMRALGYELSGQRIKDQ